MQSVSSDVVFFHFLKIFLKFFRLSDCSNLLQIGLVVKFISPLIPLGKPEIGFIGCYLCLKFRRRVSESQLETLYMKPYNIAHATAANEGSRLVYSVTYLPERTVKVVCGSTRLSPLEFTATLTIFSRQSLSITGRTPEKLRQFVNGIERMHSRVKQLC